MRRAVVIWVGCLSVVMLRPASANAQQYPDRAVATNPRLLAQHLTSNDTTELAKVRSIFYWITGNISYRTANSMRGRKPFEEPEDTGAIKPLDERVALAVLHNGSGVCDGYARLFKTLCHYAGLEAEVVLGYGKTQPFRRYQRFNANHSWNAVRVDSTWHLLDVTWASGFLNHSGTDFIPFLDEQYFLAPPEDFIREHYPDDLRWSLLAEPPLIAEFRHSPYRQRAFSKYRITSFSPAKGIIELYLGDTIDLEVRTPHGLDPFSISNDPFLDTSLYNTEKAGTLSPLDYKKGQAVYRFVATSAAQEWLYLLFNDDLILRYRLQIRERPSALTSLVPAE